MSLLSLRQKVLKDLSLHPKSFTAPHPPPVPNAPLVGEVIPQGVWRRGTPFGLS